ncbi:MAG: SPFH domain / Band 7 family protein [Candidatus Magasanikbacteria bacterium GW2011_GWD2_43_18]|uniref:SPFH domain / Band 7 family protein n=1 Tax=Candidatus Magasanikbacteria bacterium GW2011_GWE2_42_7 TaxID=1619052 RepID=A0A0G1DPE8_9BACT|nr:MAG: SPFH domain / Band 7 family protein [Candidatus Magasanikbacteria bacterium GW2011_GWC2_42_27]KKS72686.1 MAG: SPFH domain / Band 7 family protein [Candidatus Magasanikbacteria bacterium GW2011_GWE2_42_7]KKT04975.1 MAG: SPFH domain / Band 7 family protein [Candidatus Magasanikbacteria bacterium GW2011_GWD2_43_18]KKT25097.1 MAG: SPFH domain / Band 7 family protein [Candidatus Magasanikbacteria bacterium GW2011_GWA2_43_9]
MQILLIAVFIIIGVSMRQIKQHHRGIVYFLGKYTKVIEPGWHIVVPILQSLDVINLSHPEASQVIAKIQTNGYIDEEIYKKVINK